MLPHSSTTQNVTFARIQVIVVTTVVDHTTVTSLSFSTSISTNCYHTATTCYLCENSSKRYHTFFRAKWRPHRSAPPVAFVRFQVIRELHNNIQASKSLPHS